MNSALTAQEAAPMAKVEKYFSDLLLDSYRWLLTSEQPQSLFHYTSRNGIFGIVESGRLHVHSIAQKNDVAEVRYAASVLRAYIERFCAYEDHPDLREVFQAIRKTMDPFEVEGLYSFSFATNGDQQSLWRLYGDLSRGFSLRLDWNELVAPQAGLLLQCNYSGDILEHLCLKVLRATRTCYFSELSEGRKHNAERFAGALMNSMRWFAPVFKVRAWQDEAEWRYNSLAIPTRQKMKNGGVKYIDFPDVDGGSARLNISAICAGPDCELENSIRPLFDLMERNGYSTVPVYLSSYHPLAGGKLNPRINRDGVHLRSDGTAPTGAKGANEMNPATSGTFTQAGVGTTS